LDEDRLREGDLEKTRRTVTDVNLTSSRVEGSPLLQDRERSKSLKELPREPV
jgi:hypothetical protein